MNFLLTPQNGDTTKRLLDILYQACKEPGSSVTFRTGCYHFYPECAEERVSCVSNHDNDGYKKIGFLLENTENLTIDGRGSTFIFHGVMMPFQISKCKHIILKNFKIDFPVTMLAHGTILRASSDFCDLELWENTPYHIENEKLYFELDGGYSAPYWGALEIDSEKECLAYGTNDRDYFQSARAEEIKPGVVRLLQKFPILPKVGNFFVIHFGVRLAPGVFIDRSEQVSLENVTIHHALGMGVLGQFSKDISVTELRITPSDGRYASTYADGVHFVNCSGDILLKDSVIEKQMDDSLNCHGIYARVEEIKDNHTIRFKLVQNQQLGMEIFQPNSRIRFIRSQTLLPLSENMVETVRIISRQWMEVRFVSAIPDAVAIGDCAENLDMIPNLTVCGSYFGKNRARGLLITTAGKVLVEDNVFEKAGAAIRISGDANFWFESGCVQDVTIRNNVFKNCNANLRWGRAAIDIAPEIANPDPQKGCYHSNILIENNRFELFNRAVVRAKSAENLVVCGNRYIHSDMFPPYGEIHDYVTLIACNNAKIQKNFNI